MSTAEAAAELALSDRQVRRLIDSGRIKAERVGGRFAIYERQVFIYKHMQKRGRKWLPKTQQAALDTLSGLPSQTLRGSERSRLKSRLVRIDNQAIAMQLLDSASLYEEHHRADLPENKLAEELGLIGSLTKVLITKNPRRDAARAGLARNPNGNVVVIHGSKDHQRALEALALLAFGDTRERAAAGEWLDVQKRKLIGGREEP